MRYVSCSSYVAWGSCIISLSFLRSSCLSCPLSGDSCSSRSVRLSSALNSAASAPGTGAARDSGLSGILGGLVFLAVFAVAQPSARISSRCHIQTADGKQALASGARRAGCLPPEDLSRSCWLELGHLLPPNWRLEARGKASSQLELGGAPSSPRKHRPCGDGVDSGTTWGSVGKEGKGLTGALGRFSLYV